VQVAIISCALVGQGNMTGAAPIGSRHRRWNPFAAIALRPRRSRTASRLRMERHDCGEVWDEWQRLSADAPPFLQPEFFDLTRSIANPAGEPHPRSGGSGRGGWPVCCTLTLQGRTCTPCAVNTLPALTSGEIRARSRRSGKPCERTPAGIVSYLARLRLIRRWPPSCRCSPVAGAASARRARATACHTSRFPGSRISSTRSSGRMSAVARAKLETSASSATPPHHRQSSPMPWPSKPWPGRVEPARASVAMLG